MDEEKRTTIRSDENVVYLHETDEDLEILIQDLGQMIDEEYDEIIAKYEHLEEKAKDFKVSAKLDASIRDICADREKEKKKQAHKRIMTQLAKVCVIMLLVGTVTFTSFAPQAEAMRRKLYDIVVEQFDGHIGLGFEEYEDTSVDIVENNIEDKEKAILGEHFEKGEEFLYPEVMFEGYELYKVEKSGEQYSIYFKNDENQYVILHRYGSDTKMYPDSEHSKIKEIIILDQSGLIRESEERYYIYYYFDESCIVMTFDRVNHSEENVINIAESINKYKI